MQTKALLYTLITLQVLESIEAKNFEASKTTNCVFPEKFKAEDIDGDGFWSPDEFCNSLMTYYNNLQRDDCLTKWVSKFDKDNDSKISCQGNVTNKN